MMTFITRMGEGQGRTKKGRKATKSEGSGLEEGVSRALMRQYGEGGCGARGSGHREGEHSWCGQRGGGVMSAGIRKYSKTQPFS